MAKDSYLELAVISEYILYNSLLPFVEINFWKSTVRRTTIYVGW